jgi:septum formation protein
MLTDDLSRFRITLASRSPRRQQLLAEMGLKFEVVVKEFDETYPKELNGRQIAEYIAAKKADSFRDGLEEDEIVITADTIVWCNNKVLGKPVNIKESIRILKEISGITHEVITGVSVVSKGKKIVFSDSTRVTFDKMTDEEITYYAENYQPLDKAGAYGIQEWIGIIGCSFINGSYFNVVGLPVQKLYRELEKFIR